VWIDRFNPAYPFDSLLLKDITTETINRIGRIYDHTTILQTFRHSPDMALLWVFWMYTNDHNGRKNDELKTGKC
jgi:hypothetical protein